MAIVRYKPMTALLVAGAMLVSSTGAAAATTSLPASAQTPQQVSPWVALSALSGGAPAVAVAGSAATVAQASGQDTGPPPPTPIPPVEPPGEGFGGISPLWLALGAIAIGAAAYFLLKHKKHATSPA